MYYGNRSRKFRPRKYKRRPRQGYRKTWRKARSFNDYRGKSYAPRVSRSLTFRNDRSAPFARTGRGTLVYADTSFDLSTLAVSPQAHYVFRGNSIFDPDLTGVGVQPYYHDTMQTIYASYRVHASQINVYPIVETASGTVPEVRVYVFPSRVSTLPTYSDSSDLARIPGCIMLNTNLSKQNNFQGKRAKLCAYSSTVKMRDLNAKDDTTQAAFGANPSTQWYWHVITDTSDNLTLADCDIHAGIKIKYYCSFQNLLSVNES